MLSYQVTEFGKPLQQALRETPRPEDEEVVLKVSCCGVCHSDVHLHDGFFDLGAGNKVDLARSVAPPRTLGHEMVGTVVALGPDAARAGTVAVGDVRVIYPWIGCGKCGLCREGNEQLCAATTALGIYRDGGFADHVVVPHARYLVPFGNLAPEQACTYACAGVTAYSALKKVMPLRDGEPLLIIGAGGVGLSGIRFAKAFFGIAPIVAEIDPNKAEIAREAGASQVIDPTADGALKALLKSTGGGAAAVIDFVGAAATFSFGFNGLRKGGKMICVGLFGGATPITPAMMSLKAVTLIGSYVGSLEELRELLTHAQRANLPPLPISMQPLATVNEALTALRAGQVKGRLVLRP